MKLPFEPVTERSDVVLSKWMIWEVNGKNHHIIGWNEKLKEDRVTSRVVAWDPWNQKARTSSGKIYRLRGLPEECSNSNHVWYRWQINQKISTALNVSAEYFVSMYRAQLETRHNQLIKEI